MADPSHDGAAGGPKPQLPAEASHDGAGPGRPTVLVVDDERNIRRTLDLVLRGDGYDVVEAPDAEEALDVLERGERHVDLAILDINLPGMSGVDLLGRLRADDALRELPVIVISGHAAREDVALAIKLGAADFFEKPLSRDRVLVSVRNALRASLLTREVATLTAEVESRYEMIGQSPAMKRLFAEIERVAPTRTSVLITGETGTGKELISRALHRLSARAAGPFVKVNCAAIPHTLVESELFGYERGAFTGAMGRKRGLFEAAHGGTLLLDEIGDMDLGAQAKVLRALESGEIVRVGGERPVQIDVRLLAATNRDLQQAIARGRFRADLYFRLAVFPLRSPPLSERPEDLRPLSDSFLAAFCRDNGLRPKTMSPDVYEALARRRFPGNIRELRNAIERAAILAGDVVTVADLPEDPHEDPFDEVAPHQGSPQALDSDPDLAATDDAPDDAGARPARAARQARVSRPATPPADPAAPARPTLRDVRERAERAYLVEVLASVGWNVQVAAPLLGMERTNVHKRIRQYGIKRGEQP